MGHIIINCYLLVPIVYLWVKLKQTHKTNATKEFNFQNELTLQKKLYDNEKTELLHRIRDIEKLSIVTQQSQNAIMLMDEKGNIIWVNDSFTRLYEYNYEEFIKALGSNIRQTSFNPLIHERLNRCCSQKQSVTYEALNITKSGKEIWTHTSLVPLLDNENNLVGMVTVDSDIHQRIIASENMSQCIVSFQQKMGFLSEQLDILVNLSNNLFERIEISQKRMNRTEQIVAYNKEISDKMKILGINASIEAHVSGIKASGFRTIANEVVGISNNMNTSLKEISDLVNSVRRTSDKLGTEKEHSEKAINRYRELVDELRDDIEKAQSLVMAIR